MVEDKEREERGELDWLLTGMLDCFRNTSRASSEPRVEA